MAVGTWGTFGLETALAHYCKATSDSACGCDASFTRCGAHYCPRGAHHHIHDVRWWYDHYCRTVPAAADADACPHSSPHTHVYGSGGSAGGRSESVFGPDSGDFGVGVVTVTDDNAADCDKDGVPGDFDGDFETGVGGGFFGFGPWADEPVCNYGLRPHGGAVVVADVVFGSAIAFVIGADDASGPQLEPDPSPDAQVVAEYGYDLEDPGPHSAEEAAAEAAAGRDSGLLAGPIGWPPGPPGPNGDVFCTTDGSITPCPDNDPTRCGPTDDPDDCLTQVFVGSGATCGAGGDGGYWVFLSGSFVGEGPGGITVSNPPTSGSLTA